MNLLSILFLILMAGCSTLSTQPATVIEDGRKIETLAASYEPLKKIGNAHIVTADGRIIRGSNPTGKAELLKKNGITDILIFRKGQKSELDAEYQDLYQSGFKENQITHIDMNWKDIADQKAECEKVVNALMLINTVANQPERKIYFHCTMGEDRTGLLAGLFRIQNQNWTTENAFKNEMCKYGFGEANSKKPAFVLDAINKNLKPIFTQLAYQLERGQKIGPELCTKKIKNLKRYNQILSLSCSNN